MDHHDYNTATSSTRHTPDDLPYWPPHDRLDAWQRQQMAADPAEANGACDAWDNADGVD